MLRPVKLLLAVSAVVGCASESPDRPSVVVRDSAGIVIVEVATGFETAPACVLASEPSLRIGSVDGSPETQFYRVWRVQRLHNGGFAVLNQGTNELRIFDGQGAYRGTIGREGDGPNEYRRMWGVWQRSDDSLAIWDYRRQRLSTVSPSGGFGVTTSLNPPFLNPPTIVGLTPDNGFLLWDRLRGDIAADATAHTLRLMRYDAAGQRVDSLGAYPFQVLHLIQGPEPLLAGPLFEARVQVATGSSFYAITTAAERAVWLHEYSGQVVRVIRWSGRDRAVTDADVTAYFAKRLAGASGDRARAFERALQDQQPVAARFPITSYMTVDDADRIWVWEYQRPSVEGAPRALVFESSGQLVCKVENLPSTGFVADIGADWLVAVEPDSNGVEFVHLYELRKP